MNEPTSPAVTSSGALPPPAPDISLDSLAQAYYSLRTALNVALVMIIVLSGSLFVFFVREISIARRQIQDLNKMVADYEKTALPAMEDFRSKLQVFTRSHPDFGPIYTKYFGTNNIPFTTGRAQPAAAPAGPRLPGMPSQ